jgi:hypothetical protein
MPTSRSRRFIKNQAVYDDMLLILKVRGRFEKVSTLYERMQEAARSKREHTESDCPPLPFLYQG